MKQSPLRDLMRSTLQSQASVPADYQRRALVLSERSGDTALLMALVSRRDAPADLVAKYRADKRADVRARYLMRGDLTEVELTEEIRNEKRANVLVAAVRSEQASPELLEIIKAVFRAKPTAALADALARTELDLETALPVLKVLDPRADKLSQVVITGLRTALTALADQPAAAQELSEVLENPDLCLLLLDSDHLSARGEARVLRRALEVRHHYDGYARDDLADKARRSLARHNADPVLVAALDDFVATTVQENRQDLLLEELLHAHGGTPRAEAVTTRQALLRQALVGTDSAWLADLADAFGSGGSSVTKALLQRSLRGSLDQDHTLGRLLINPHLPTEALVRMVRGAWAMRDKSLVPYAMEAVRMRDTPEVTSAVLWCFPTAGVAAGLHERDGDAEQTLARLGVELLEDWNKDHDDYRTTEALSSALASGVFEPDEAVKHLPWVLFRSWDGMNKVPLYTLVAERLTERLGEDAEAWENFEALSEDYDGTVGDLLDVAVTLAGK